jgi:hypothetical protein
MGPSVFRGTGGTGIVGKPEKGSLVFGIIGEFGSLGILCLRDLIL